jgi:hypothetical protein|tara:strand:+ start:11514 stop:11798 length:285 start_codon:yes stop_codon:yes gene_type:complete
MMVFNLYIELVVYATFIYANPAFPLLENISIVNVFGQTKHYKIPIHSDLYLTLLYGDWRTPSGKHAEWPQFFYNGFLTSIYKPFFDPNYKVTRP